jgi:hypothetical protein
MSRYKDVYKEYSLGMGQPEQINTSEAHSHVCFYSMGNSKPPSMFGLHKEKVKWELKLQMKSGTRAG